MVTGHSSTAKAIILDDSVLPFVYWEGTSGSAVHDVYRTHESPAILGTEINGEWVDEIKLNDALVNPNGSAIRSIDMYPGMYVKPHRTWSIDHGIVVKGSVVIELDDGERRVINEGDVIVQRGTIHSWKNESSEWNRIFFVMLGATPIEVKPGQKLEEVSAK